MTGEIDIFDDADVETERERLRERQKTSLRERQNVKISIASDCAWVVRKRVFQRLSAGVKHLSLLNEIFLPNYMARKICDFNHISPELSREQVDELIGYYKTTHQNGFYLIRRPIIIINS